MSRNEFFELYDIVFDLDGHTKACGRQAVRNLILAADEIEPDVLHGNLNSGFMYVSKIQVLYQKLKNN